MLSMRDYTWSPRLSVVFVALSFSFTLLGGCDDDSSSNSDQRSLSGEMSSDDQSGDDVTSGVDPDW